MHHRHTDTHTHPKPGIGLAPHAVEAYNPWTTREVCKRVNIFLNSNACRL